jgi:tryptophan-rich sensory protein
MNNYTVISLLSCLCFFRSKLIAQTVDYDNYNYTENPKYAPPQVILNRCEIVDNAYGAMWRKVSGAYIIYSKFDNKNMDMALLKCAMTMENNEFLKGNEKYTDIDQWPQGVNTLW